MILQPDKAGNWQERPLVSGYHFFWCKGLGSKIFHSNDSEEYDEVLLVWVEMDNFDKINPDATINNLVYFEVGEMWVVRHSDLIKAGLTGWFWCFNLPLAPEELHKQRRERRISELEAELARLKGG